MRSSGRVVFGADCARRWLSTRLGFGACLWPGLYSVGRAPQKATKGSFCEPWTRLLLVRAAGDEPMGIHKCGPHGGLRSCGCREGGPGLGGVVRSLFSGFGLLLSEVVVRAANPARVFGHGGWGVRRSSLFCPLLETFVSGRAKEPICGRDARGDGGSRAEPAHRETSGATRGGGV